VTSVGMASAPDREAVELREFELAWASRTILLVDIVESVRLIEQDQLGTISRWIGFVDYLKREILPRWGGRPFKSLGDGLLLDFADVRSAVAAAFAIQKAKTAENAERPAAKQIFLRMGMEVGDVVVTSEDLHGHGVNLAARLMTLAGPGEIIVSKHVRDRLTPELDVELDDLGDCYLRHISEPVRAYRIGPPGPRPVMHPTLSAEDLAPSIAVVPFSCHELKSGGSVVGQVLAEEIIRALSQSQDLAVISRLSTTVFQDREITAFQIGSHLRADYVLSGRCRGGDRCLIVDVELADPKSGRVLWTKRFKGRYQELLEGGQELLEELVADIGSAVVARELQRSRLQSLPTLKAYTLLMGAIALMHRLSRRDFEQARELLGALIDRGTRQPVPQAWLANWHVLRVQQGWSTDRRQDARHALECTKRALDVDPDCSLALAIDGFVHTNLLKRLDIAEGRYDLAIAANPSNSLAWLLKGTLHAFKGEGEQAIDDTQRALKLTPLDPHKYFYDSLAASACIAAEQYDAAYQLARRSLRLNRKHTSTLRVMIVAQWELGLEMEARQTLQELLRLEPTLTVSKWLKCAPSAAYRVGQHFAHVLRQAGLPS
jgi:adenylate cyclase